MPARAGLPEMTGVGLREIRNISFNTLPVSVFTRCTVSCADGRSLGNRKLARQLSKRSIT